MKILVGMSGGVDSSLTAQLLLNEGHDVTGVTMNVRSRQLLNLPPAMAGGCYGTGPSKSLDDAPIVAGKLGINHHMIDVSEYFEKYIISYFRESYEKGETPIPCVFCNLHVKFGALMMLAVESGIEFDYFATGHYVRLQKSNGRIRLQKAIDLTKDQTYFLSQLTQNQLQKLMFPLGSLRKEEVRMKAEEFGLHVHNKPDSKGFYAGDYREILKQPEREGDIVDLAGNIIGKHKGIWNFTIGQRKGLGNAPGVSRFVVALDPSTNRVITGGKKDILSQTIYLKNINWFDEPRNGNYHFKAGNTHPLIPCEIQCQDDMLLVHLEQPVIAAAKGQAGVIYEHDTVLAGGFIFRTEV